jgi:hypothetical protein
MDPPQRRNQRISRARALVGETGDDFLQTGWHRGKRSVRPHMVEQSNWAAANLLRSFTSPRTEKLCIRNEVKAVDLAAHYGAQSSKPSKRVNKVRICVCPGTRFWPASFNLPSIEATVDSLGENIFVMFTPDRGVRSFPAAGRSKKYNSVRMLVAIVARGLVT